MPQINPMEAVVQVLEDEGVRVAFGVPGAAILPLYQALAPSSVRHISVRHEEGGTHAADGYARITGDVGICIGTSGPAGTNMITGLYTALADSVPIICITGQAPQQVLHKEAFQAVDIVEIAKPVCKWAVQVRESAQLPHVFRKAFRIAREGRPGPVLIDLPLDVQKGAPIPYDASLDQRLTYDVPVAKPEALEHALALLLAAERPMLMPGGGVIIAEASEELMALAEHLQIPVTPTLMAKGAIPEDHPLYAGIVGIQTSHRFANQAFLESDLILAVGARFAERHTGDLAVYRGDRTFVQVDIDPFQLGRVFPPDLGIASDAKLALSGLLSAARREVPAQRDTGAWPQRVADLRRTLTRKTDFATTPIHERRVFQEMNAFFDPEAVMVTAIGLYQIQSGQFQQTFKPRHYLCCGQAGPLGWEVPACIGVKLGAPDKLVVGVVGDYSFQFLVEEVAVAVQYRVPYVIVMLNNGYMGLIRQGEEYGYAMNYGVDLAYDGPASSYGIDHVGMMEAMGALGRRVHDPEDIADALAWAAQASADQGVPALVEIFVARGTDVSMGPAIDRVREFDAVPDALTVGAGEQRAA